MNVVDLRNALNQIIKDGYGNLEMECSVDMSIDGDEETYVNRIFGKDPYNVRYDVVRDLDGTEISRKVQILFENGESNYV